MDDYKEAFEAGVRHERNRMHEVNRKFMNTILDLLESYVDERTAELKPVIKE